ncbi:MAG: hypothetical protein ACOYOL_07955 [Chthoniobacterales bacterium]
MNEMLLFLGLLVLTAAFLSYDHAVLRRLGLFAVGLTTFAAGYLPTSSVFVGLACVSVWLLLPWVEILVRVRKLRLPLRRSLQPSAPPGREEFADFGELSDAIESSGFEHVADLGWEMDGYRQFFRLYAHSGRREEAAITYVAQHQMGFHFVSVTSRAVDGAVFTTWDCPVSSSLKTAPAVQLNRASADAPFDVLLSGHEAFLRRAQQTVESLRPVDPERVRAAVEGDMEMQLAHNLREGVLRPADEGHGRYSWRGMLYLWFQFLRDIFRLT